MTTAISEPQASPKSSYPAPAVGRSDGGSPPACALVDFREDDHREPDQVVVPAPAPTPLAATSAASVTSSPTPPRMSSPQDFKFSKELGRGSWSTVMEAVHIATNKHYAVKVLSKSQLIKQKKVKYATVEKDALIKLSGTHPGIVKTYAAFQDETSLYFVLDLAPNGDLADLVKKYGSLSLRCAQWYTAQIIDSVLWMHSKGIVHRDLKPENVLLDSQLRVKLTDFGSAYMAPNGDLSPRSSTFVGSAAYVSPELLDRSSKTTSSSSDIWAIGCTLFFMIAGFPAFAAINDYQSFRKIEILDYTFPENFYETAQDLVQRLVVLDPADRLGVEPKSSASHLRAHPFFSNENSETRSDDRNATAVRWESLWTDPPVPPETGIVPPATPTIDESSDEDLWENVVHEFSLANVRSPEEPFPASDSIPLGPLVDAPPNAVPTRVVETAPPQSELPESPSEADVQHHTENDVGDATLRTKDWSAVLAPDEYIRRIATVTTPIRKGLLKQTRTCALLLTSRPRVACVVLEEKHDAPTSSDIKQSFSFRYTTDKAITAKGEKQHPITACRSEDSQRKLILQCGEKHYAYEFKSIAPISTWVKEISSLVASG